MAREGPTLSSRAPNFEPLHSHPASTRRQCKNVMPVRFHRPSTSPPPHQLRPVYMKKGGIAVGGGSGIVWTTAAGTRGDRYYY